jgi:hypothetical protein
MLALTGTPELTDITMVSDVAGLPEAQVSFEVRMTLTLSPFDGV